MRFRQRAISMMLVLITIFSCFTTGITPGYATKIMGNGLGGSGLSGKPGGGTFNPARSGVRIYFVNQSTGQRASNIVDIVNEANTNTASYYMCIDKIKTETNYDGTYFWADDYTALGVMMNEGRQEYESHKVLYPGTITEWYTGGTTWQDALDSSVISGFPAQIIRDGDWAGEGVKLRNWMLGTGAIKRYLGGGGGAGDSGGISDTDLSQYDGELTDTKTIEDQINDIKSKLDALFELNEKRLQSGTCTVSEAKGEIADKANQFIDTILNKTNKDGTSTFGPDEVGLFATTVQQYLQDIEQRLENIGSQVDEDSNKGLAARLFNTIFETAYAADTQEKEGMLPLREGEHITKFLETNGRSEYLFNLVPSQCPKGKWVSDKGEYSVIKTAAANGLVILMEPLILDKLQANSEKESKWAFFGTPHELGLLLEREKTLKNGWKNGPTPYKDRGGWLARATHVAFPWSMYTDTELKVGSITIKPGIDLKNDMSSMFTSKKTGSIRDKRLCYDSELADPSWGLGLHFYILGEAGGPPGIPTYDSFPHDPSKTPDHKVNKTPHPAPDPDPYDPGWIPLAPGEDPEKYPEITRTVNIVKVYDTRLMQSDASGQPVIQHDHTFTRKNCPGDISIQHEPEYKVVGYFTAPEYYGEIMGWDANPGAVDPTEWDECKAVITDKTEIEEWELEAVKGKKEMEEEKHVKIAIACDCDKSTNPDTIDGEHGKHYHDNTLYVHLLREEKIPETSTYDEPDHPPTPGPQPYVDPHPSEEPKNPPNPNVNDPETTEVKKDDPFVHYRIVKCYETCLEKEDGTEEWSTDYIGTTYETNPIVYIQDEGQSPSAGKQDLSWHLEEWQSSLSFRGASGKDTKEMYGNPLSTDWKGLKSEGSPVIKSGTAETKIDLRSNPNGPDDPEDIVTLYVRLIRRIKEQPVTGAIIIQQSQISKTIHSNDGHIGGMFGNYSFATTIGSFATTHTSYYHDYCCAKTKYHDCGHCHGHSCKMNMPGNWGDDKVKFVFDQYTGQDVLEVKVGVNPNTDPKVYGKGGSSSVRGQGGINYPRTVNTLFANDNKYYFNSDGKSSTGAEYVTVLWRGANGTNNRPDPASPPPNDIPTLALFKKSDIEKRYGTDNYKIPYDMITKNGGSSDKVSKHKRMATNWLGDLEFSFGILPHGMEGSDLKATSSCSNIGNYKGGCVHTQTMTYYPIEGTKHIWGDIKKSDDFYAGVAIRFYAGQNKSPQTAPLGSPGATSLRMPLGRHKEHNIIQCKQFINFYPYIRMTYMVNSLEDAKKEEKNTDAAGYKEAVRRDTYVLSEYESSVLPADAITIGWEGNADEESLTLISQQWSVHQKAISGGAVWNGRNQVLPGGAIYQLATQEANLRTIRAITYQTVVDEKARSEYLSKSLSGDEYTEHKVFQDHLDFMNDLKEVLDNLKVVQWVNKDVGATTAWPSDYKPDPSRGIIKLIDDNYGEKTPEEALLATSLTGLRGGAKTTPNTEEKYYMRPQKSVADYQGAGDLTSWTKTQETDQQGNEGDFDVFNLKQETAVFKLFADTSGNIYLATIKTTMTGDGLAGVEGFITSSVASMRDLNADTYAMGQRGGANVQILCDKSIAGGVINSVLSGDAKDIDDRTSFITNFVSALTRNKGKDLTSEWANKPDGKWYNEAFDGVYLVRQNAELKVGFKYGENRVSALDPALCPQNKGQSDLYTSAFLSQFCTDSKSNAPCSRDKALGYIGTFKDTDITLPDMEKLYQSKKFYIPNANVQDLN